MDKLYKRKYTLFIQYIYIYSVHIHKVCSVLMSHLICYIFQILAVKILKFVQKKQHVNGFHPVWLFYIKLIILNNNHFAIRFPLFRSLHFEIH